MCRKVCIHGSPFLFLVHNPKVEVDEAVFRKNSVGADKVAWHEWVGIKRRGDPQSLILHKRPAANATSTRAKELRGRAVPPPMTKEEWVRIRSAHVGKGTLVHSDGAVAYRDPGDGVYHDHVCHGIGTRRRRPEFTKRVVHETPAGSVDAVAGTQCLDGWWSHAKRACTGVKASNAEKLNDHIRTEQWRHWIQAEDRWVASGEVFKWARERA